MDQVRHWVNLTNFEIASETQKSSGWADCFEIAEGIEDLGVPPGKYLRLCDETIIFLMRVAEKKKSIERAKHRLVPLVIEGTALGAVSEQVATMVCDWEVPKPDF